MARVGKLLAAWLLLFIGACSLVGAESNTPAASPEIEGVDIPSASPEMRRRVLIMRERHKRERFEANGIADTPAASPDFRIPMQRSSYSMPAASPDFGVADTPAASPHMADIRAAAAAAEARYRQHHETFSAPAASPDFGVADTPAASPHMEDIRAAAAAAAEARYRQHHETFSAPAASPEFGIADTPAASPHMEDVRAAAAAVAAFAARRHHHQEAFSAPAASPEFGIADTPAASPHMEDVRAAAAAARRYGYDTAPSASPDFGIADTPAASPHLDDVYAAARRRAASFSAPAASPEFGVTDTPAASPHLENVRAVEAAQRRREAYAAQAVRQHHVQSTPSVSRNENIAETPAASPNFAAARAAAAERYSGYAAPASAPYKRGIAETPAASPHFVAAKIAAARAAPAAVNAAVAATRSYLYSTPSASPEFEMAETPAASPEFRTSTHVHTSSRSPSLGKTPVASPPYRRGPGHQHPPQYKARKPKSFMDDVEDWNFNGFVGTPAASPMAGEQYRPTKEQLLVADKHKRANGVSLSPTPLGSNFARISPQFETENNGKEHPVEFLPNIATNKTCLQSSSSSSEGTFCRLTAGRQTIATASEDSPYIIMDLDGLYYVDHISFAVNVDEVSEQSKLLVWCSNVTNVDLVADVSPLPFSWKKVVLQDSGNFSMHVHTACSYIRIQRLSFGQLKLHDVKIFGAEITNRDTYRCQSNQDGAICSHRGECIDGECACEFGYGGPNCEDYMLSRMALSFLQGSVFVAIFVWASLNYRVPNDLMKLRREVSVSIGDEEELDEADKPIIVAKVSGPAKRSISADPPRPHAVDIRQTSANSDSGISIASSTSASSSSSSTFQPLEQPGPHIRCSSDIPFVESPPNSDSLLPSLIPVAKAAPTDPQEGVVHLLFASPLIMMGKEGVSGNPDSQFRPIQGLDIQREYNMLRRSLRHAALASGQSLRSEVPVSVSCATVESFHTLMTLGNVRCLHFSGHCTKNFIAFEDAAGQLHSVSMDMLRGLLRSTITQRSFKTLRLVVLNACNSDAAAREFVLAGVAHVIAYRKRVRDQVAAVFTRAFYLALACGRTVRDAFESAREAVQSSPSFADDEMDAFVLLPDNDSHREVIWRPTAQDRRQTRTWPQSETMQPLPPLCEDFLGRHASMWTVLRYLMQDRRRLVAVCSEASGMGKTQVSLAVAHHLHQRRCSTVMRDGIFYVKSAHYHHHHHHRHTKDSPEEAIMELASLVDNLWDALYPFLSSEASPADQNTSTERSVSAMLSTQYGSASTYDIEDDALEFAPHFADRRAVSKEAIMTMESLLNSESSSFSSDEESVSDEEDDIHDDLSNGEADKARRLERLALSDLRRRAVAKSNVLARALAQRAAKCLIVLDDFRESPLTIAVLHGILDRTSNVRILVTSAQPLHLGHTLNVNVVNYQLQPMHAGDAALLFVRHLKRKIVVNPSSNPREATLQEVAQHKLIKNCVGNPREIIHLAVELSTQPGADVDLDAALDTTL